MSEGDRIKHLQYRGLIFCVVLAAILCAAVWSVYENVHSNERRHAAATAKYERFTECIASRASSAAQCKLQAEQSRYDQSAESYDLKAQQEMARWAALMLVVTSIGVLFVAATLKTASDANEGFKASAEVQLRPYMSFQHMEVNELVTGAWSIQAVWKNTGQTPTRQMTLCWGYSVQADDLPNDFDYPDTPKTSANEGTISVGSQGVIFSNGPVLTAQEVQNFASGKMKVFYWGWIEYNDGFEGSPRRRTEFCQRFIVVPDKAQIKTGFITFGPHNGADEDCLKQVKNKHTA